MISALISKQRRGTAGAGMSWLRGSFLRKQDGSVSIETMIILPAMFWSLLFGFSVHDSFRAMGLHQKAAFSIGDAVSRETVPLDDAYLNGAHDAFEYLAHSQGDTEMRLSLLYYDEASDEYRAEWSKVRGNKPPLSTSAVKDWHDKLPMMPDQEHVVLLETWSTYEPVFNVGLNNDEINTFVFTRPRYAPVVCFDTCD